MSGFATVRHPLVRLRINGEIAGGVMSISVRSCGGVSADQFQARLALSAIGRDITSETVLRVEISLGIDNGWQTLLLGQTDNVRVDALRGEVSLEGRDLTAVFIGTRLSETFSNRTASEVATTLAARHGLQAMVDETDTLVGRYYESDHERTVLGRYAKAMTEWDLLVQLAQQEGFDVFVSGECLNFRAIQEENSTKNISAKDCISLHLERAMLLAQDISVTVKSWNSQQHVAVEETATLNRGGEKQSYFFLRPNLYPAQAQQLSRTILSDIAGHEWTFDAVMPGDFMLAPRSIVRLVDTGTSFDGDYRIIEIDRSLSERGFVQRIRCLRLV